MYGCMSMFCSGDLLCMDVCLFVVVEFCHVQMYFCVLYWRFISIRLSIVEIHRVQIYSNCCTETRMET